MDVASPPTSNGMLGAGCWGLAGWLAGKLQRKARNVTGMGKAIMEAGKSGQPVAVLVALWVGGGSTTTSERAKARSGSGAVESLQCCAVLMGAKVQLLEESFTGIAVRCTVPPCEAKKR